MRNGDMDSNICGDDGFYSTGEYCGEWLGATIKKLPLWGAQDEDSDNYF